MFVGGVVCSARRYHRAFVSRFKQPHSRIDAFYLFFVQIFPCAEGDIVSERMYLSVIYKEVRLAPFGEISCLYVEHTLYVSASDFHIEKRFGTVSCQGQMSADIFYSADFLELSRKIHKFDCFCRIFFEIVPEKSLFSDVIYLTCLYVKE